MAFIGLWVCCAKNRKKPRKNGARDKHQVIKNNLVSTAKPDVINCSDNTQSRNSLDGHKVQLEPTALQTEFKIKLREIRSNKISPLKIDLGFELSDHIKIFQILNFEVNRRE